MFCSFPPKWEIRQVQSCSNNKQSPDLKLYNELLHVSCNWHMIWCCMERGMEKISQIIFCGWLCYAVSVSVTVMWAVWLALLYGQYGWICYMDTVAGSVIWALKWFCHGALLWQFYMDTLALLCGHYGWHYYVSTVAATVSWALWLCYVDTVADYHVDSVAGSAIWTL